VTLADHVHAKWLRNWVISLSIIVALIPTVAAIRYSPPELTGLFYDDAFYYYKTAENWIGGHGITFDSINETNGFHPLWFSLIALLYGVSHVLGLGNIAVLRIILVVTGILTGASSFMLFRSIKRSVPDSYATIGVPLFCLFPGYMRDLYSGLEIALATLLFLMAVDRLLRFDWLKGTEKPTAREDIRLGIIFALVILARLDTAIPIFGFLIMIMLLRIKRDTSESRIFRAALQTLRIGIPVILILAPYLYYNLSTFGHLVPISGAIKSDFPLPNVMPNIFITGVTIRHFVAVPFIIIAGLIGILVRTNSIINDKNTKSLRMVMTVTSVGLLFDLTYKVLFVRWSLMGWYFALYPPIFALATVLLVRTGAGYARKRKFSFLDTSWVRKIPYAFAVVSIIGLLLFAWKTFKWLEGPRNYAQACIAGAQWVDQNLPQDARLGMTDCGVFGYFARRVVVNLDGLINNWRYQDYLSAGRFEDYLNDMDIGYLAMLTRYPIVPRSGEYSYGFQVYSPNRPAWLFVNSTQEIFRYVNNFGWMIIIWRRNDFKIDQTTTDDHETPPGTDSLTKAGRLR